MADGHRHRKADRHVTNATEVFQECEGLLPANTARKRQRKIPPYRFQKEHSADSWMSNIWPPELWGNTFSAVSSHSQFAVLCYSSPRKLIYTNHQMEIFSVFTILLAKFVPIHTLNSKTLVRNYSHYSFPLRIAFSISQFTIQIIFLFLSPQGKEKND